MSTSKFAKTHNLVAFLKKPNESEGFEQIVDFLNANPIKYAFTVNPTIYTSYIQQFWDSAKVKTVNEDVPMRALVDGKRLLLLKHLLDVIFNYKMLKRKATEVLHTEPQTEKHIPTSSHDPLPSGKDRTQLSELMEICTKLPNRVLSLEQIKTNQAAEIKKLKKRVNKLKGKKKKRTHGLKRLYKGRIAEIDANEDLSLINETAQDQGRMNDEDLFGVNDLDGDEVIMDVTVGENVEQDATVAEKEFSVIADVVVTTAESVEEVARKLDAQMKAEIEEEERIAREKDEANRAVIEEWDDVQATINAKGHKQKDFKGKSFDVIKKMFDKVYKRVNTFVVMDSEVIEGSKKTQAKVSEGRFKRARDDIEQESAKRQRLEKEDDTAKMKRCLKIVPEDDDDVTIEATPLSYKSTTIVDYKIYKEWKISYFKIIRADGNS
nr:hypothetical protein [Tanacetum cinerariifolium]